MDKIYIRDLTVECIVGTKPSERVEKQRVLINIVLETDISFAARSDHIEDTLNYKVLKDRVVEMVAQSQCYLIERLASRIADLCLADRRARGVTVTVDKPDALTGARSVGVEISRRPKHAGK